MDDVAQGPAAAPLGRKVRRGLLLSAVNTVVGRAGTFLAGLILARLLSPEDYGLFAVALVVLNGLLSVNELGVSLAIVRWPGDPRKIAPTVTTLALIGSGLLFAVTWMAAPWLADLLGAPEATGIIRGLALGVIFDGLTAVPAAAMTREFQQGRRMVLDLTSFAVITGVTIGLAIAGFGAWSLVAGRLVGGLISVITFYVFAPLRPRPGWDRSRVRPLLGFGLPLAGTSLLVFAMVNIDMAVVGAVLGPVQLGFYLLATNLANWPVNVVSTTMRRVTLAGFSRLDAGADGRGQAFTVSLPVVVSVVLPVCLGLSILATPIIVLLYGEEWRPAGAALQFLALVAAARVVVDLCYDFLAADGRTHWTLIVQVAWLALFVPLLILATRQGGIGGAAALNAAVAWLWAVPAFLGAVMRGGVSSRALARPLLRPLLAASALSLAVLIVQLAVESEAVTVLLSVPVGAVVYLGVVWPFLRPHLAGFRRGRAPEGPGPEPAPGPGDQAPGRSED